MTDKRENSGSWRNPNACTGDAAARANELLGRSTKLRGALRSGLALGTFLIELPTRGTLGAFALAGFDFVVLDMEHSAIDFAQLQVLIDAGNAAGLVTLVRPWNSAPGTIGKILDCGAHGIMAPHIESADHARDIVDQSRFAPAGRRGFSPLARFDALETPLRTLSDAALVVVQIEGREGLSRVRDIASVPGLDAIFVGPYDLSLSLDVPPGSPEVIAAAEAIAKSVPADVHLGVYVDDASQCGAWAARRFSMQCVSFDGRIFADAARDLARRARRAINDPGSPNT